MSHMRVDICGKRYRGLRTRFHAGQRTRDRSTLKGDVKSQLTIETGGQIATEERL